DDCEPVAQIDDGIAGANRASPPVAEHPVQRAALELRRPGEADERRKVVPILIVERVRSFPTNEIERSGRIALLRAGVEQIPRSGNAEHVSEVGELDAESIGQARHTLILISRAEVERKVAL